MKSECRCCQYWSGVVRDAMDAAVKTLKMAREVAGASDGNEAESLQAQVKSLKEDNKKHAEANRELSARANKISMPSSKKKTNPGKAGRPKGQKATINKRPDKVDCTEIVDFDRCPGCGGKNVSEKPTGEYDRIVKTLTLLVKTIKYVTVRRWCRDCKKQVSSKPPRTGYHAWLPCMATMNWITLREVGLFQAAQNGAARALRGQRRRRAQLFEYVGSVPRKIRRIRRRRAWHARVLLVCIQEQDKQGPADGPGTRRREEKDPQSRTWGPTSSTGHSRAGAATAWSHSARSRAWWK